MAGHDDGDRSSDFDSDQCSWHLNRVSRPHGQRRGPMWSIETQALPRTAVIGSIVDWTPYLAGVGIGLLSWIVFVVVDDPIGITTAFSAVAGAVAMPFLGADAVWGNSYWKLTPP